MEKKINLIAALKELGSRETDGSETSVGLKKMADDELPMDDILLYEYCQDLLPPEKKSEVEKRAKQDEEVQKQLSMIQQELESAVGIGIAPPPKRAASPGDVMRTSTRDNIFQLILRPSLKNPNRGILMVKTSRRELEGTHVVVRNSRRRDLLRGKIIGGESSQRINNIENIQMGELIVVAL